MGPSARLFARLFPSKHGRQMSTGRVGSPAAAAFSPNGRWVSFGGRDQTASTQLLLMHPDVSARRLFADDAYWSTWSPDSKWIAYVAGEITDPEPGRLIVTRPDGSGRRVIAEGVSADSRPAWSPDGRVIAFAGYGTIFGIR